MSANILVVEDERITAEDIKDGLKSLGYRVPAVAYSGEDAIKMAKKFLPDLILMDIHLEGEMDGIEAAEEIRERLGIPVIYLTAYSDSSTVQRAKITEPSGYILKEPFGFIHKPFEESELHTAIEITLYRHKMEKRLREHELWLSAILKNVKDAIIITNIDGQIKFMNNKAEDITGWMQMDAVGERLDEVFKIFSKDKPEKSKKLYSGYFNEVLITSKDGNKIEIEGNVTPIENGTIEVDSVVLVFRNID